MSGTERLAALEPAWRDEFAAEIAAVTLRGLPEPTLQLVVDLGCANAALRRALAAVEAVEAGAAPAGVEGPVVSFDGVVADVLRAAGLPRDPRARAVFTTAGEEGQEGALAPAWLSYDDLGRFWVSVPFLRRTRFNAQHGLKVMLHESLHLRAPNATRPLALNPAERAEYEAYPGYEEGLAEALAREVCLMLGWPVKSPGYGRYVAGWQALAEALAVSPQTLLRTCWGRPFGSVRSWFAEDVAAVLEAEHPSQFSAEQVARIARTADALFAACPGQRDAEGEHAVLRQIWEAALVSAV